jgi:hypothetical protein
MTDSAIFPRPLQVALGRSAFQRHYSSDGHGGDRAGHAIDRCRDHRQHLVTASVGPDEALGRRRGQQAAGRVVRIGRRRESHSDVERPARRRPDRAFPIAGTDPSYEYDCNPGKIHAPSVTRVVTATPAVAATPTCLPEGPVEMLENGVQVFSSLDGLGHDAVAHESQDLCQAPPGHDDLPLAQRSFVYP